MPPLELIETAKQSKYPFPTVSVYAKMKRFVFNVEATALLYTVAGGALVEYIQTFRDTKYPDVFYIKPCGQDDPGARKLGKASKSGKYFDGSATLAKLGWEIDKGITLRVLEDKKNPGMLLIDRNETV